MPKHTLAAGLLLMSSNLGLAREDRAQEHFAPGDVVLLAEGVCGGFIAADPHRRVLIVFDEEGPKLLVQERLSEGAEHKLVTRMGRPSEKQAKELPSLLRWMDELPREQPRNCDDVYGLNTSIALCHAETRWANGAPQSCVRFRSPVVPDEEQRKRFERAVHLLLELAKVADEPIPAEVFDAALQEHREELVEAGAPALPPERK